LLDVRGLCSFADYFVICSGEARRHVEAIWEAIGDGLRARGVRALHREGVPDSGWMLADYGSVIIHVFLPEERDYYQLETLRGKGIPVVRIQ